ncbi:response regulator [Phenylobacterium sp.]|uniref:response regulator n=1 Tax=Phenylobacterium sp. TaxID=1871053 RepID=UPI00374CE3D3
MLLPLLILTGLQLYDSVNAQRRGLEDLSKSRAAEVMRLVDAQVSAEMKLARALASATPLQNDDIPATYAQARELVGIAGTWRSVRLSDPSAGVELFDLRRPLTARAVAIAPDAAAFARTAASGPTIGGVGFGPQANPVVPLHVPVMRGGTLRYVLTVELDPMSMQRIAAARFPTQGVVSALVDRDGRFIARNMNYAKLVGRPGSAYLRAAVRQGGQGVYRGFTLEGTPNYTAYVTSPVTGWSTHVAVAAHPFDAARYWSVAVWLGVALGCLALSSLIVWLILRDIAQARREEDRRRQSQKMEAVGQLTGGIAHDFNNLLTAIIGGLDLVLRRSEPSDRDRRYLEGALDAAQRGAKLTSKLLAFSRTERLGVEAVDIRAAVDGMSVLLDQSLGATIAVVVDIAPDARWVSTDRNQLELALLNLAVNARDAMPGGGVLTIASEMSSYGRKGGSSPCVALSVSDTGQGMEPHVLEHALDPFFTTKGPNKGTGLGLAQVYSLATQSDGQVMIDSVIGQGTRVRLLLPVASPSQIAMAETESASKPDEPAEPDGRRVLVLDDDDSVRNIVVETLRAQGYVVSEASTGEEALNALEKIDPDLFLLDFVMPAMNGAEVARRARDMRPDQKLLIISGHLDNIVLDAAVGDVSFLKKPFDGPTLALRVAQVLNETEPANLS